MHSIFKRKGIKTSPNDSWHLLQIFTDTEYQGKGNYSMICLQEVSNNTENSYFYIFWEGMMSKLVREAFAYSPESTFTLEATTPKSRDQYVHLGFEVTHVFVISSPTAYFSPRNCIGTSSS